MADTTPFLVAQRDMEPLLADMMVDASIGCSGDVEAALEDQHAEDEDVYKMKEILQEMPQDVIQYIEAEGVVKLGEFEAQDSWVLKALGKEPMLVAAADHIDIDWEAMWRERLSEQARLTALGWSAKMKLEALVVNIRDAAAPGSKGLLQPLVRRWQAGGCSSAVFALPAVSAVISYKWDTWARRFLMYELAAYCAWLAAFTSFSLMLQDEDPSLSLAQLMATGQGAAAVGSGLLAALAMLPFMYAEVITVATYGAGWLDFWNLLDIASYAMQLAMLGLHLQRAYVGSGWFSILVASQHVLMWSKLHYFARVFNPTKSLFFDTIMAVLADLRWFLMFLGLTLMGFALAFYCLFRFDREQTTDFNSTWHAFASMFAYLLAMFDYSVLYGSSNPNAAMVLFMVFEFIMNVMMLNILIAVMTNSFAKVSEGEALRFLRHRAEIIDELESTLPRWVQGRSWHPPFLHLLKLHPEATYEVSLSSVWSGIGAMERNLLGGQAEVALQVQTLTEHLGRLEARLNVLSKIVVGALTPAQQAVLAQLERGFTARHAQQEQQQTAQQQAAQQQAGAHHQLPGQQQGARPTRASMPVTVRSGSGAAGGAAGAAAGAAGSTTPWRRSLARSPGGASMRHASGGGGGGGGGGAELKHSITSVGHGYSRGGRAAEPLWLRQQMSGALHEEEEVVALQALRSRGLRRCASL